MSISSFKDTKYRKVPRILPPGKFLRPARYGRGCEFSRPPAIHSLKQFGLVTLVIFVFY
nr:MAG TPA: hypothetical protein [Caudoviricetes sp.]